VAPRREAPTPAEGRRARRLGQQLGSRALASAALRVGALTLSVMLIVTTVRSVAFQSDVRGDLYVAGRALAHGMDPYNVGLLDAEATAARTGEGGFGCPRAPTQIRRAE
jgi:hypothetical protein